MLLKLVLVVAGLGCGLGAIRTVGRTRITLALGTFVLVGALAFLQFSGAFEGSAASNIDRSYESAAARRLGVAIAADIEQGKIGEGGADVVVGVLNLPLSTTHTRDHAKAYLEGLMEGLKGAPAEVRSCSEEYNEQVQAITFGEGGGVDMMTVVRLAAESVPDVDVFVTFAGLPNAAPDRFDGLPPVYAFNGQPSAAMAAQVRSGAVRGVVTFREDVDWLQEPDPALSWEELFDQRYVFLGSDM